MVKNENFLDKNSVKTMNSVEGSQCDERVKEIEYLQDLETGLRKLNRNIIIITLQEEGIKHITEIENERVVVINKCIIRDTEDFFYAVWIYKKYYCHVTLNGLMRSLCRFSVGTVYIRVNYGYNIELRGRQ